MCDVVFDAIGTPFPYEHAKLTDFGFAQRGDPSAATLTGMCGSPLYMSPEVVAFKATRQPYGIACDLWVVGVMAYALASGTYPFNSDTTPEIFEAIKTGQYPAMVGGVLQPRARRASVAMWLRTGVCVQVVHTVRLRHVSSSGVQSRACEALCAGCGYSACAALCLQQYVCAGLSVQGCRGVRAVCTGLSLQHCRAACAGPGGSLGN